MAGPREIDTARGPESEPWRDGASTAHVGFLQRPVLAFSADVDMAQFEGAASVFDGLVRKPISPHELVTALSRCLRWDAAEVSTPDAAAG